MTEEQILAYVRMAADPCSENPVCDEEVTLTFEELFRFVGLLKQQFDTESDELWLSRNESAK